MAARPVARRGSILRLRGVPVLMYHRLSASREGPVRNERYCLPSARFQEQLVQLRESGYRACLLRELWSENGTEDVFPRAVLTFDDGAASDYEIAFPLLQEAGIRAEFFVNPGTVGREGYLTWEQIAEMQRAGQSFQSHGYDHVDLSRLGKLELLRQIRDSKRVLEDKLARAVDFLALPHGLFGPGILDVALREGYRAVCTSQCRPATPRSTLVSRVPIYGRTGLQVFRRLLTGDPMIYGGRALRAAAFYLPKRVLRRVSPAALGVDVLEERV